MCGRFALKADPGLLKAYFGLDETVEFGPRYNIPPGTDIPVIRHSPAGTRVLHLLRWGLVPHWADDPGIGARLNNARGESVAEKPAFRDAFRRRRCLIPADGFYEWKTEGKTKLPYYFSLKSGEPLAMAGLWESWRGPDGEILRTCCIITTGPNAVMAPVHDRMPVIVARPDWQAWLAAPAAQVAGLVRPFDPEPMQAWPVGRRVSRSVDDDPGLLEPV
ncbi:SOS response-associated peptidase [Parasulfuritortus cantonensis]|uniref:Abasic site processing protein n=1 Tax=Parasulfuritortus cantonensis TaxID=2528202 RepID=A0A4R1B443_9PROT|nr:SOS response-associated peptidase [Parasulfuritortus cantonensis]TCJ12230.1 SOS response-associated peptidase [Parasulfuritortus cantonensis]